MSANTKDVAKAILETMPLVMRSVRADISRSVGRAITVPQFRVLSHLREGDWCLSELAAHQQVSMATMSKLVSGLVDRGFIERSYESQDRRFIMLRLTPKGRRFFDEAYTASLTRLAQRAELLSSSERNNIVASLKRLRPLFEEQVKYGSADIALEPANNCRPSERKRPGRLARPVRPGITL